MLKNIAYWILIIGFLFFVGLNIYSFFANRKPKNTAYHIKIKFAHGITTKLTLNETQYETFKEWENQTDGYYIVGDEFGSHVKLHREYVCAIEVKKR